MSGGKSPSETNVIQSITMATKANAVNFGDLTAAREQGGSSSNLTRGVHGGGTTPSLSDVIDYITIASAGDATDFGNLAADIQIHNGASSNCHSGIEDSIQRPSVNYMPGSGRAVFHGGNPASVSIEYFHIPTLGNSFDFGYLTSSRVYTGSCSDSHGGL